MKNNTSEPPGARLALQPISRRDKEITLPPLPLNEPLPLPQGDNASVRYRSVENMVHDMRPDVPVHCLRPATIAATARRFLKAFPGEVMYAVKTNPDKRVLRILSQAGVAHFDVASLSEVKLVADTLPDAELHFMHPVKSREAIAAAYNDYRVRDFSLDSHEELQKILDVTDNAADLGLFVRIAVTGKDALFMAGKFGVPLEQASSLLLAAREAAQRLGICFHVGGQCMQPEAYATAMQTVADLLTQTGVRLDVLDIGGGFPSIYPGVTPPPLSHYMRAIKKMLKAYPMLAECQLMGEPGRALVAEGGSVVVRVELRKGNMLYINDGTYGSLFDAGGALGFVYPVKAIRRGGSLSPELAEFGFFGPTCDSIDTMKGPFHLPADIAEGDWIEIGQLGAYGAAMRTGFNGFGACETVELADKPILSVTGVN